MLTKKGKKLIRKKASKVKLQDKVARYEGLIKFGQLTSSSLELKNIKKRAVGKIKKLLDCDHVSIFRVDAKTNELYRDTQHEDSRSSFNELRYAIDEHSFAGASAFYRAIFNISNPSDDIRYGKLNKEVKELDCHNILVAPLVSKGEILGVIQAVNSHHGDFNDEDIHFIEAICNQLTIAFENAMLFERLQNQFVQVVLALADAIGKKDTYTGGHTKRVGIFSEMIARELDLSYNDLSDLKLAAVLHDIGKIGIEDKILKKRSPLTKEEFSIMRDHPRLGYEILGHIDGLENVIDGMRFHHERPDGKGYPYGLKGDEIPVIAMIISVADTFDAMISTRPYRKGLPPMVAYEEILQHAGTQFCPRIVEAFKKAFEKTHMYKPEVKIKKVA